MHNPAVRMISMGIAAVAIGAGAGVALLQALSADASPPPAASSTQLNPNEEVGRLPPRLPAAVHESAPGAVRRDEAPPTPPAPIRERAPQGSKKSPPSRTKLALGMPRFEIDAVGVGDASGRLRVPVSVSR
jgi:hypothetical protein